MRVNQGAIKITWQGEGLLFRMPCPLLFSTDSTLFFRLSCSAGSGCCRMVQAAMAIHYQFKRALPMISTSTIPFPTSKTGNDVSGRNSGRGTPNNWALLTASNVEPSPDQFRRQTQKHTKAFKKLKEDIAQHTENINHLNSQLNKIDAILEAKTDALKVLNETNPKLEYCLSPHKRQVLNAEIARLRKLTLRTSEEEKSLTLRLQQIRNSMVMQPSSFEAKTAKQLTEMRQQTAKELKKTQQSLQDLQKT